MSMCSTCKGKYNSYAAIKANLSNALDQTSECVTQSTSTKSILSSVVISGASIVKDDIDTINQLLEKISGNLSTMIKQCNNEMSRIEGGCPGSDHYKPVVKNTRLNSENE